jgi:K+-transporting ATPase ATPase A chain
MSLWNWLLPVVYLVALIALVKPVGAFMARVYSGGRTFLHPVLGPLERLFYRAAGVHPDAEMDWKTYALALLAFNVLGILVVYALQRLQGGLPLNPRHLGAVSADSAFNTATSFATTTNWQGYSGETTLSYLTQMLALTVQNFVSAATGMAVLVAVARGFARHSARTLRNFWDDLTRGGL